MGGNEGRTLGGKGGSAQRMGFGQGVFRYRRRLNWSSTVDIAVLPADAPGPIRLQLSGGTPSRGPFRRSYSPAQRGFGPSVYRPSPPSPSPRRHFYFKNVFIGLAVFLHWRGARAGRRFDQPSQLAMIAALLDSERITMRLKTAGLGRPRRRPGPRVCRVEARRDNLRPRV